MKCSQRPSHEHFIFFQNLLAALISALLLADCDGILVPQEVVPGPIQLQGGTKSHASGPKDPHMNTSIFKETRFLLIILFLRQYRAMCLIEISGAKHI